MDATLVLPKNSPLFFVGAEALVLQSRSQRLFALNTFSAFLWSCLENHPSIERAVNQARQQFNLSGEVADKYAQQAIAQWRELGLLDPQTEAPERALSCQTLSDVSGAEPLECLPADPALAVRLLDRTISIAVEDPTAVEALRSVIGHLEVPIDHIPTVHGMSSSITVRREGSDFLVYRNTVPVARFNNLESIAPTVKSVMLQEAIDHFDYLFYFHSGVLSTGTSLLLLPGAQGAGKSTLTAGLLSAGMSYYSDEVALIDPTRDEVRPVPIALCSKQGAWPVLADLFPDFESLPVFHRLDNKVVKYIPPPVDPSGTYYDRALPVRYLVFPVYRPGVRTELRPLSKVKALERLMTECLAMKKPLTVEVTRWLVQWIEEVACYELANSSLSEAVDTLVDLVSG